MLTLKPLLLCRCSLCTNQHRPLQLILMLPTTTTQGCLNHQGQQLHNQETSRGILQDSTGRQQLPVPDPFQHATHRPLPTRLLPCCNHTLIFLRRLRTDWVILHHTCPHTRVVRGRIQRDRSPAALEPSDTSFAWQQKTSGHNKKQMLSISFLSLHTCTAKPMGLLVEQQEHRPASVPALWRNQCTLSCNTTQHCHHPGGWREPS